MSEESAQFIADFDFSCEACGKECKKGDTIHDVGNNVWCVDRNCTGGTGTAKQQEPTLANTTAPSQTRTPAQAETPPAPAPTDVSLARQRFNDWLNLHNSVWNSSVELANAADPGGDSRGKIIMAQVFYKTAFAYINP